MQCLNCNNPLQGPDQKKFCSLSCSASYSNKNNPRRKKTNSNWHDCPTCGKQTKNKYYCSHACRPKETHEQYRARMNEANARYMARRKFQTPADENISALQEYYANCPKGYEVDHIIPISKGGLHSLSNLQYLTKEDNRRKSNKILAPE